MEWDEFVETVEHRLGMFTGRPTYERAVALVTGFDLGAGTNINERMQQRAQHLRNAGPVSWSTALLWDVTNQSPPDARHLSPEQDEIAIKLLCAELRAALSSA